jgi:hypothetical protein
MPAPSASKGAQLHSTAGVNFLFLQAFVRNQCAPTTHRSGALIWRSLRDYSALRASPFGPPSAKPPAFKST